MSLLVILNKITGTIFRFAAKEPLLKFDNATKLLYTIDKRTIIFISTKIWRSNSKSCGIEVPIIFYNCKKIQKSNCR